VAGKLTWTPAFPRVLSGRSPAGRLVKGGPRVGGGGGGGRPDLAQAGGKDPEKLDAALALVPGWVERTARS